MMNCSVFNPPGQDVANALISSFSQCSILSSFPSLLSLKVNSGSASASEIVSGAVQDLDAGNKISVVTMLDALL
jgi:hypothetical protein